MVGRTSRSGSTLLMVGVTAGLVFVMAGAALMRSHSAICHVQHEVDRENAGYLAESTLSVGLVRIGNGIRSGQFTVQLPTGSGVGWISNARSGPEVIAAGHSGRVTRVYSCRAHVGEPVVIRGVKSPPFVTCQEWAEIPAQELGLQGSYRVRVNPLELFKKARSLRVTYVPSGRVRPVLVNDDEE